MLVLAGFAAWEVGPVFRERLVGVGGVDHPGTLWTWAAFADAVAAGDPGRLVHTPWFFHPWGQALYHHTGLNLVDAALALPFGGSVAGLNLATLLVLVLNGVGGGMAARSLGAAPGAAAWAGLALALAPYPLYELVEGRPTQALVGVLPLAAAAWVRVARGEGRVVVAGLLLALAGYGYWYYGLVLGLLGSVALPVGGRRGAAVLGVAALAVAPAVGPLLGELARGGVPGLGATAADAAFLLHSFQPLAGGTGYFDGERFVLTQHALPLALTLGAAWAWRRRPGVLAAGVGVLLLSVGPWLLVGETRLPEPLYRGLAAVVLPLERWWHPARALGVYTALAVLALPALGPRARGLVVAVTLYESVRAGLLPLPTWDPRPPAGYRCLAAGDDGGALLELPWAASPTSLAWGRAHGRPISGGMWETEPDFQPVGSVRFRGGDPFVSGLLARSRGLEAPVGDPAPAVELGYRYVVLRRDELPREEAGAARAVRRRVEAGLRDALGAPAWEDARTVVWPLGGTPLPCLADPPVPDLEPGELADRRRVRDLGARRVRE